MDDFEARVGQFVTRGALIDELADAIMLFAGDHFTEALGREPNGTHLLERVTRKAKECARFTLTQRPVLLEALPPRQRSRRVRIG